MAENTLNKIKNGGLSCACSVLNKINIATEESRLKAKYESLGRRLLPALEKDALDELKNDPEVVELVGNISEIRARIRDMKKREQKGFQA